MTMIIDASVAVKWFVDEDGHEDALALLDRDHDFHAPDLILSETANTAWKKCRRGEITRDQAAAMVTALPHYFSRLWPAPELVTRALELAFNLDHPVYDGLYLACAEAVGGTLITADKRLIDVTRKAGLKKLISPLS